MEDFRGDGMPEPSQYAVVKMLATAIHLLSTNEKYPVSVWELHAYLAQNCAEANGKDAAAFFSVTVARALDQMTQTEMLERKANGFRLTANGRWSFFRKEPTPSMGELQPATNEPEELGEAPMRAESVQQAPMCNVPSAMSGPSAAPALPDNGTIGRPFFALPPGSPTIESRPLEAHGDRDAEISRDYRVTPVSGGDKDELHRGRPRGAGRAGLVRSPSGRSRCRRRRCAKSPRRSPVPRLRPPLRPPARSVTSLAAIRRGRPRSSRGRWRQRAIATRGKSHGVTV
jgi:hypothetical protein